MNPETEEKVKEDCFKRGYNSAIEAAMKISKEYGIGMAFTTSELLRLGEKIADKIKELKK